MNIDVEAVVKKKMEAARERKLNEQIIESAKQADKKSLHDLEEEFVHGRNAPSTYFSEQARFIAARAEDFHQWRAERWQKKGISKKISKIVTAAPSIDAAVTRDGAGVLRLCGEVLTVDLIKAWREGKLTLPVDAQGNPLSKEAARDWRADRKGYARQHGEVREVKLDGGYVEKTLSQYVKIDVGLASGGKTPCFINQKDGSVMTESGYGFDGAKDENEAISLGARAMLMDYMRRQGLVVWPTLNDHICSFFNSETDPDRLRSILTDTATVSLAQVVDEPPKSILAAYDLAKTTNNWGEYNKKDPQQKCKTWCAVYRGHDTNTDSVQKIIGEHGARYLQEAPDLMAHLRFADENDENGNPIKAHVTGVTYTCMLTNKHLMTAEKLRERIDGGEKMAGSRLMKENLAAQALGITDFSLENPEHVAALRNLVCDHSIDGGVGNPAWGAAKKMSPWMVAVLKTKDPNELAKVFNDNSKSEQPAVLLDRFTKIFSREIAEFLASPERVRKELKKEKLEDSSIANAIAYTSGKGKILLRHGVLVDILPPSLTYGYKNENEFSHRPGSGAKGWENAHKVVHPASNGSPAVYQHDAHFLVGYRSRVRQEECTYSHVYHDPSKGIAIDVWTRPTDNRMSKVTGDSRGLERTTGGVPLLHAENFLGKFAPTVWIRDVYESFKKDPRLLEAQNVSVGLLKNLMNNEITLHGMFGLKKKLASSHLDGSYNQKKSSEKVVNQVGRTLFGMRF